MPIYKGSAHTHYWLSENADGSINTATKPAVVINQNGTSTTIDPARVLHSASGFWYVSFSSLEMGFDYVNILATHASLRTYAHSIRTDDATATIFNMASDFTTTVRTWILGIYNAVGAAGPTINAKLGGFTGTGSNTLLGFFLATLRKDVPIPSDIGGTYDDASHSLQAIRERGDTAWTTGAGGGSSMSYALKLVTGSVTETLQFNQQFAFGANGQSRIVDVLQGSIVIYPTAALASALEGGISQGKGEQVYQLTAEAVIVAQENNTIVTISGNIA